MRSFSCDIEILTVFQNKWLANDSQNAILSYFEEYYIKQQIKHRKGIGMTRYMYIRHVLINSENNFKKMMSLLYRRSNRTQVRATHLTIPVLGREMLRNKFQFFTLFLK